MGGSDVRYTTRGGEIFDGYLTQPAGSGKAPGILLITASLGFCFGGRYALLGAARLDIDAAAAYHGTAMGPHVDEIALDVTSQGER